MSSIGLRVKVLRERRGMSQAELARLIGKRQPSLSAIESGDTKSLKADTLQALCEVLVTTPQFILSGDETLGDSLSIDLTVMESELLAILRSVPPEKRIALLEYARFLRSGEKTQPPLPHPGPASIQKMRKKG